MTRVGFFEEKDKAYFSDPFWDKLLFEINIEAAEAGTIMSLVNKNYSSTTTCVCDQIESEFDHD